MPSTGSQLTDFTETTKRQIETAYGAHCWHCESSPIRNACVIAQASDRARVCGITSLNSINPWTKWKQVSRLQNLVRISLRSLRQFENAVPLCGLCHRNLDLREPRLLFFLIDIDWFIKYEMLDFEDRKEDFRPTRKARRRRPPTKTDYEHGGEHTLLYTRLSLGNWHPRTIIEEEAPWDGDPMAAFQSSFRALGDERMPIPLRQKLFKFSLLLDEHDVESSTWNCVAQERGSDSDNDDNETGDSGEEGDNDTFDNSQEGTHHSIGVSEKQSTTGSKPEFLRYDFRTRSSIVENTLSRGIC